jgi:hypothetical protein
MFLTNVPETLDHKVMDMWLFASMLHQSWLCLLLQLIVGALSMPSHNHATAA